MTDTVCPSSLVNCAAYAGDGQRLPPLTVDGISDALEQADGFVWVGLHEPEAGLLTKMQEEFGLHELAIEDAMHAHQRPKIEIYGDSLFIVLHTAQRIGGRIAFGETHIFLGPRYLLTVRHGASLSYAPVRTRCEHNPGQLASGPSYALYAVLDFIVDNLMPIVDQLEDELEALEKAIFEARFNRDTIQQLYALKRDLVRLRLAVAPMQDILHQLVRFHGGLIHDDVRVYIRDVHDHAMRVSAAAGTVGEMLTAVMSLNLSLATVAQGEVVRKLAGWAAIVAVPTLIASWYGMNFQHMPELAGRTSYFIVSGITVLGCVSLYAALRRARWL
jgi:magnesium transporter